MRALLFLVGILAAAALLITMLLWRYQERIVFQPTPPPFPEAPGVRRIEYRAEDGQDLYGYVIEPRPPTLGTLVLFHGNADLAAWRIPWARGAAAETGWRILLAEYRGYGGLSGAPTVAGVRRDARAAIAAARGLGAPGTPLAIYGHSLGSAIAAEAAEEARPIALLLEAPFTSAADMARRMVSPALVPLWRVVSRVPYDTRARVAEVDAPVWVVHGGRDGVIPVRMGEAVYRAAKVRGELLVIPEAGHNDVGDVGAERYRMWLRRALQGEAAASPPAGAPNASDSTGGSRARGR